jgi:thiol-disulfide isomerase/thioredoxin
MPHRNHRHLQLAVSIAIFLLAIVGAAARAVAPIVVTPADAPTIKQAIAAEKGHVVLVNFWATYCVPCCEEYPYLVILQNRYRAAGLVVMSVSADEKKDIDGKVRPFLEQHHAYFRQFLEQSSDPDVFIDAFDPSWQGDLPRTFIYDKQGRLAKVLADEQTLSSFVAAVKPLLTK